jgi:hypothetical protein
MLKQINFLCLVVEGAEHEWPAWLAGSSGQTRESCPSRSVQRGMHTCRQVAPAWLNVKVHALVGAPALPLNAVHHACKKKVKNGQHDRDLPYSRAGCRSRGVGWYFRSHCNPTAKQSTHHTTPT